MKTKELTCIVCPMGCSLTAELDDDGRVVRVTGNTCPRGKAYAEAELTHPTRTLTTTVRVENRPGKLLPVRTARPISKEKLTEAMAVLRTAAAKAPVHIGDIVVPSLLGESDVVACEEIE